jgi:hypothetical protein
MNTVKGIYHNGIIEPMIKPEINIPTEVLIIFPDDTKTVKKIGGLFKNISINYSQIEADLKELNKNAEDSLLKKIDNE